MVFLIIVFPELVSWGLDGPTMLSDPTEIVLPETGGSSLLDSGDFEGLFGPPPSDSNP